MPSAVIFGAVGGAPAVVAVAIIVLIVVVTAVMIVTKGRKPNYQDATGKGAHSPRFIMKAATMFRHACNLNRLTSLSKFRCRIYVICMSSSVTLSKHVMRLCMFAGALDNPIYDGSTSVVLQTWMQHKR